MGTKRLRSGKKTIATATTAEALQAAQITRYLEIRAESTNTGLVYVGDSSVDAATGYELAAGERLNWADMADGGADYIDLAAVFLDVSVNGDGATYAYVTD